MRILTVSDYIESELTRRIASGEIDGIDLVLACGDLPPEYLAQLARQMDAPLYYVLGNHDIRRESYPPIGCEDLHARVVRFRGIRLLGLEGSNWYNDGPNQYTDREMKKMLQKIGSGIRQAGGIDIVVAHAPPRRVHDGEDPCHMGFESFRWLIHKYRPAYFVHGHIHRQFDDDAQRVTMLERTKVINTYGYFQLEIETEKPAAPVWGIRKLIERIRAAKQGHR